MQDQQVAYLNGEFIPLDQAKVSVLDRGFIFGDGIYEVVPVYSGKPFRWDNHQARLNRSLKRISIDNPMTNDGWAKLVQSLIKRHPWKDQFIYMQITRGVAKREHLFPKEATPTVFAMCSQLVPLPAETFTKGIRTVTMPDERWLNCDIKSTSLLGNVLARQSAADADATECLMFRDGLLTEGSASNIWIIRNGRVLAPKRDRRILEGIRVGLMEELCQASGLTLEFRNIERSEVFAADEILVTSATKEVVPATLLDGQAVGAGVPGPIFHQIHAAYQQAKQAAQTGQSPTVAVAA